MLISPIYRTHPRYTAHSPIAHSNNVICVYPIHHEVNRTVIAWTAVRLRIHYTTQNMTEIGLWTSLGQGPKQYRDLLMDPC